MKKIFNSLGLFLLLFTTTSAAWAAIDLKLGHVVREEDVFHKSSLMFKELVESRTNEEVTVTIYPNAELGEESKLLESLRTGTVDIGIITSGPIINFLPGFGVLDLPFLFSSPEHAHKVMDGPIGESFFQEMEKLGWKGLAYGERGFRNLTNNKRPIEKPDDIKGLKIRVMQNQIHIDSFTALGANAVPMAWTNALTALRQGTIDGQENPLNAIATYNINELNKYLSLTRHAYSPSAVLMSMKTWDKLTPEQQKIITESAFEAAKHNRGLNNDNEANWLQTLKDRGMQVSEPDLAPFRDAVRSVYEKYERQLGKELIQSILDAR